MIDGFLICKDEEELIQYCLESFAALADQLRILSIVDNGSTDSTLDIIDSFRERIPIRLQVRADTPHHGHLRTCALEGLTAPWILYLDADETFTADFPDWLRSDAKERGDRIHHYKYTTILDRYHYVEGGNGPCMRLFRNKAGVHFPQSIHTEPQAQGLARDVQFNNGPYLFDHTACKSREALWAKGWRYKWANREKVPAVGPEHEYVGRVATAHAQGAIREFTESVKRLIFTGP